jgi:putative transposase
MGKLDDKSRLRLVDGTDEQLAAVLPERLAVQLGDIAQMCRDGLMAVAVEAGLATALAMMHEEAEVLCGGWNARDPERTAQRGGTTATSVTMGGQRLPIRRPRVHAVEDGQRTGEVPLATYGVFSQGDLLERVVMERMLAGVATRGFERASEPIGAQRRAEATGTSKSTVSRRFVNGTAKALDELLARDLSSQTPAVLVIDGADFAGQMCVAALVVTADGTKVPVGLRAGDTENKTVVTALLADLVERGLAYEHGLLVLIDGGKALGRAVRSVFGDHALIQRCQLHKRRNVTDHLPKAERERIHARVRAAFADPDPASGLRKARRLAAELDKTHPDAAGSLREGLEDMFTVARLGIDGTLRRTLVTTNMIESMFATCRQVSRNVKRWRNDGDMRRRWLAAGMLEAERKFRRVKGHKQMPQLVAALRRHAETVTPPCDTDENKIAA